MSLNKDGLIGGSLITPEQLRELKSRKDKAPGVVSVVKKTSKKKSD
jgi:hypothetical protein